MQKYSYSSVQFIVLQQHSNISQGDNWPHA